MKRSFLANLLFLILLNLLIKPFWFLGIEVNIQNTVGNAEYGLYFSLFGFSLMLNILLDMGITNFNNREVARNEHMASKYFNNIILVKLYLGLVYAVIMFATSFFLGYTDRHLKILAFLVINQFLSSFLLYLRSYINGMHLFIIDSILSISDKLLMIILCGSVLYIFPELGFKIEWFVYAQTVSYIIPIIIALWVLKSKLQTIKPRNDLKYFLVIARESRLFAILVLIMYLYSRADAVLLERLLPNGETEAGIYAQSYRLIDFASNYAFMFSTLLLPIFSRMLKEKKDISPIVQTALNFLIVPTIILCVGGWFFRCDILNLLYKNFEGSGIELGFLFIGFLGVAMNYIFGTLLTSNGNLKELIVIAIFMLLLNFSLNILLIPTIKAQGAALAFMITQLTSAGLQFYYANKRISIKFERIYWLKCLLLILILSGSFIIFKNTNTKFELKILLFAIESIVLIVVLRFYKDLNLKTLINEKT